MLSFAKIGEIHTNICISLTVLKRLFGFGQLYHFISLKKPKLFQDSYFCNFAICKGNFFAVLILSLFLCFPLTIKLFANYSLNIILSNNFHGFLLFNIFWHFWKKFSFSSDIRWMGSCDLKRANFRILWSM